LAQYKEGVIFDEIQNAPEIFSYLQQILDESDKPGQYILTGSNNFIMQNNIVQSLAGRIAYLFLLPFSIKELENADLLPTHLNDLIYQGSYPPIYTQKISPAKWFPNYIRTYVERDVRLIKNITDLAAFERFLKLCAGRTGQLLNMSSLGVEVGVDSKTIAAWISVLESCFIIHLLRPHHQNFNKRVVKMPKLYFYDTGLLCYLLGITSQSGLEKHPMQGNIFENWIITEIKKNRFNAGINEGLYFFRDSTGNEIDLLMEKAGSTIAVEIKSAKKINPGMISGLRYWKKNNPGGQGLLIYMGEKEENPEEGIHSVNWKKVSDI
jgi:predicted AAA+ superfamily ATPase